MSHARKRRKNESDEEFISRIARTRGRLEQKFWERATRLKEKLAQWTSLAKGMKEEVQLALARAATRGANRAYLNEDLEGALLRQERALKILRRLEKSGG